MNERRSGNRGLLGLAFLLAACGGEPASTPAEKAPPSSAAAKVLAFGDSLTAGKDLEDPETEAYPAVLERLLREKGWDVSIRNAGASGDTTADALARLDWSLAEGADVVIVALGSNDTFQGKRIEEIEKNLEAILRRVRERGAVPVLVSMKTFPNFGPYYGLAYQKMFPRLAKRAKAVPAPFLLEGVAGAPGMNLEDGIHPNAAGHRRAAENILLALEKALREARGGRA